MNENIYDYLNDMDQDLSLYDTLSIEKEELGEWKKRFNRKIKKPTKTPLVYIWKIVAAAAIVFMTFSLFNVRARAGISIAIYHIQDILGIDTRIVDYSVPVNMVVENEEVSIAIGDVIVGEHCLYVVYSYEDDNDSSNIPINVEVNINGEAVNSSSRSFSQEIDNEKMVIYEIHIPYANLSKEYLYKLNFYMEKENGVTDKIGDVSFISSADKLMGNNTYSEINREIIIGDGYRLLLENYYSNYINQGINAKIVDDEIRAYDIVLKGKDNLGRSMFFYLSEAYDETANFRLAYEENDEAIIDMSSIDSFEVVAYYNKHQQYLDDKDSSELETIGDSFVISVR